MKILILTYYFPPDLSAGSFRMQGLCDAFRSLNAQKLSIEVLTTLPNRYSEWSANKVPEVEIIDGVSVRRVNVGQHRNDLVGQIKSFLHFAYQALSWTRSHDWDIVVASSSRLMTAALGAVVAMRKGVPLYLDIRDLFSETFTDVFKGLVGTVLRPFVCRLELWAFQRASHINVVSSAFLSHVQAVAPDVSTSCMFNGIDDVFLHSNFCRADAALNRPLEVLYAGNIGEGQGLSKILPVVAKQCEDAFRFRVIGSGGRLSELKRCLKDAKVANVEVMAPVSRTDLLDEYRRADILFLHLNDYPAFRKVLPSKIFEYAATGKPIVAGVAGFAADFLKRHIPDAKVFSPCDAGAMLECLHAAASMPEAKERSAFVNQFNRKSIMRDFALSVIRCAQKSRRQPFEHLLSEGL